MAGLAQPMQQQIEQSNKIVSDEMEARKGIPAQLESTYNTEVARQEKRLGEQDTRIEGLQQAFDQPMPSMPKLQDITPYQPKQVSPNEMMDFGAMAMGFAALASLGVRGGIVSALNGAAGAMKGYSEGNIAQAKLEMEQADRAMQTALAQNKKQMDEYNAIMHRRDLSLNEKLQMFRVYAARDGDEAKLATLRIGNLKDFFQLHSTMISEQQKIAFQWANFQQQAQLAADRNATTIRAAQIAADSRVGNRPSGLTEEGKNDAAAYLILNGRIPVGMARAYGQQALEEIQNRATEMRQQMGLSSFDAAAAGPITKAKVASLLDFEKKRNNLQAFERMLDLNIDVLKNLSSQVSRTDSPYLNKSILWLQKNAQGDPAVAEYLFQVNTVQAEAARVLQNPNLTGELTDTARREMQDVIGGNLNPEQLNKVLERAQADARNRSTGLDKQRSQIIKEIQTPLQSSGGGGASLPTGSKKIGKTPDGKDVWQSPDGKKWVE